MMKALKVIRQCNIFYICHCKHCVCIRGKTLIVKVIVLHGCYLVSTLMDFINSCCFHNYLHRHCRPFLLLISGGFCDYYLSIYIFHRIIQDFTGFASNITLETSVISPKEVCKQISLQLSICTHKHPRKNPNKPTNMFCIVNINIQETHGDYTNTEVPWFTNLMPSPECLVQ